LSADKRAMPRSAQRCARANTLTSSARARACVVRVQRGAPARALRAQRASRERHYASLMRRFIFSDITTFYFSRFHDGRYAFRPAYNIIATRLFDDADKPPCRAKNAPAAVMRARRCAQRWRRRCALPQRAARARKSGSASARRYSSAPDAPLRRFSGQRAMPPY